MCIRDRPSADHVYTLHAELEGRRLAPWFDRLLAGWRSQGYEFVTLSQLAASLDATRLATRAVSVGTVAGRSGTLAVTAADFKTRDSLVQGSNDVP